jgi:hypothetical protein
MALGGGLLLIALLVLRPDRALQVAAGMAAHTLCSAVYVHSPSESCSGPLACTALPWNSTAKECSKGISDALRRVLERNILATAKTRVGAAQRYRACSNPDS